MKLEEISHRLEYILGSQPSCRLDRKRFPRELISHRQHTDLLAVSLTGLGQALEGFDHALQQRSSVPVVIASDNSVLILCDQRHLPAEDPLPQQTAGAQIP